ncbi:MAG: hypothetical protein QM647_11470 [Asticcacaulis sp.]|uniref:hypothetical protein n=1 Tax=Asticcacaulis sp. TaxID=1872648 RepID=UPI0039E22A72
MKTILAVLLMGCVMAFAVWAHAPESQKPQLCAVLSTACLNTPAEFTHVVTDFQDKVSEGQPVSEYISLYRGNDDPEPTVRFEARTDSLTKGELPDDFTCAPRGKDELICHRPVPDSPVAETAIMRPASFAGLKACDPPYDVLYLTPRAAPAGTRLEAFADLRQAAPPPRYTRWQTWLNRRKCT